jgi:E3 ubiquitin-protein ligase TRIP12
MRIKVNVERDNIIEHGFNLINDEITSKFRGYLEFEYKGEIGNGLGPTLEFYTLIINKIKEQDLWYKTTDGSLYPKLLIDSDDESEKNEKILKLFNLLGYVVGRAIYDDRLLDIPLSKVFWNLVLDKPILFKNIKIIDSNLYKTIKDFIYLIREKKEYIKKK